MPRKRLLRLSLDATSFALYDYKSHPAIAKWVQISAVVSDLLSKHKKRWPVGRWTNIPEKLYVELRRIYDEERLE